MYLVEQKKIQKFLLILLRIRFSDASSCDALRVYLISKNQRTYSDFLNWGPLGLSSRHKITEKGEQSG